MRRFLGIFLHLGALGPLLLGIADSSFLFLPFGNDLLLVISLARDHRLFATYVPMAALGSTIGVLLLDIVCRKGGEEGLKKKLNPKRFEMLKSKIDQRAGFAVALACIAPPPFPFTAVIAAASAFEYPRAKLLLIAFFTRALRFSLVGLAAIEFGGGILRIARSTPFLYTMWAFIAFCVVGSVISVYGWLKRRH